MDACEVEGQGYEVVVAKDGLSCISIARQEKPDLILVDLGLPAGDGFTTLQRLRSLATISETPVAVLTAQGEEEAKERAMAAGANVFFEKTVDKDELLAAIWRLIDGDTLAPI